MSATDPEHARLAGYSAIGVIASYLNDEVWAHQGPFDLARGIGRRLSEAGLVVLRRWAGYHTLEFTGPHGYLLRHPLDCLSDDGLLSCRLGDLTAQLSLDMGWATHPGKPPGRYICGLRLDGSMWVSDEPERPVEG